MKALDESGEQDFVAMTALAEYIFNSHYPVEGVFCYMSSPLSWDAWMLLEAGYIHDICVKFKISFPPSYPDTAPFVRVAYPAVLTHPLIDPQTGEVDVRALLRDVWNPVESCTVHLLAAIKVMLIAPCRQPFQLGADATVVNHTALEEYLTDPNVTMKWRKILIDSLKRPESISAVPADELIDVYLNDLNTGSAGCPLAPAMSKVLKNFDLTLQSHVDIMVQRIRSNENVSFLKLVQERVAVIHEDLQSFLPV